MKDTYTTDGEVAADDLHTSVTNEAPADKSPTKAEVILGETGAGEVEATYNEIESVPGYRPVAEMLGMSASGLESAMAGGQSAPFLVEAPSIVGLRDIGEASFGNPAGHAMGQEAIIGVDDRVRVTATASYPWRAIASLLITARDGSQWIGTGWFVSARTLVTAGHCVFIKGSPVAARNGWVRSITVIPGRNASQMPYGQAISTVFRSVNGWTTNGNNEYDYGAIILPIPLGQQTGTFGYGAYPDAELKGKLVNIAGYPGDKPAGTMWFHANTVTEVGPRKVYYTVDTMGGQSGAPAWRVVNGKRIAVAVHAYGGATANSGTRINGQVAANINGWRV